MKQIVLADSVTVLTPRQVEVLRCASEGLCTKATAIRLGIAPQSVKDHRAAVLARIDAPNMAAAVATAVRAGVI